MYAFIQYGRHMKRRIIPLLTIMVVFCHAPALWAQHVVINEFMFAPESGEAEWIELWNPSDVAVSLSGWTIRDAASNPVLISQEQLTIAGGAYLVLASSLPLAERWKSITANVLVVPGFPVLNNSGDEIVLADALGRVIDSLRYTSSWNSKKSSTVERRRPGIPFTRDNAGPCPHPDGGTPGIRNTLTPVDIDLAVRLLRRSTDGMTVTVVNEGLFSPAQAALLCSCDANGDGRIDDDDPFVRLDFLPPAATDSVHLAVRIDCSAAELLRAVVSAPGDTRPHNDTVLIHSVLPVGREVLIFNEIMAAPLSGKAEWIELLNLSERPLTVGGSSLAGAPNSSGRRSMYPLPKDLPPVPADGYLVVASDSSILHDWPYLFDAADCVVAILNRSSLDLGNSGDEILFIDHTGEVADSIVYSASWHHALLSSVTGRSLELLHPELRYLHDRGWTSCSHPSGGTPGRRNAAWSLIPTDRSEGSASLACLPNPFSPDGDGFEDHCVISWRLPATVSSLRLRLFDVEGRNIRTLLNNVPAAREGMTVWDGLDDAGRRARIGIYIVLLEALDVMSNTVSAAKSVVVVATRL
jgi:hypothetical protein